LDNVQENNRDDAELIAAVRSGDDDATSELFRRHYAAALAFAASLAGQSLAADLVSESFARVLGSMRRGQGPDVAFRPYLLTAIRRVHVDHIRRTRREVPVDDVEVASSRTPMASTDGVDDRVEAATILRAFRSLPERWQAVLWHTAVENEPLQRVAEHLGMNANSVAALSFRAREGLRVAYLAEHLERTEQPECRAVIDQLVKHVRGALPPRQSEQVTAHVAGCLACTAALADLRSINSNLGAVLAPAVLGGPLSEQVMAHFAEPATNDPFAEPATNDHTWAVRTGIGAAIGTTVLLVLAVVHAARTDRPVAPTPDAPSAVTHPAATSTAAPSATPTTTRTRKPTRTPATHEVVPTQQPSEPPVGAPPPTASPSATPTQSAAPATPSQTPLVLDAALGIPGLQRLTTTEPFWFHVQFPVTGSGADLVIRAQLTNVADYQVHTDHEFGSWHCTESGLTRQHRALDCTLQAESGRSQDFALDVTPDGDGASVEAALRLASGQDPHPENNLATIEVPAQS